MRVQHGVGSNHQNAAQIAVALFGDRPELLCHSACNFGSQLNLDDVHRRSGRADQSCLKEIDLCSAVHLSLDELEPGDLAFGLAVRPRLDQGSMNRGDIFGDPRSEGAEQAVACGGNPGNKISLFSISDHGVKPIGECSRGDQRRHTGLDSRYGDGIGFAHVITRRHHQPCYRSSRGHLLQLLIAGLFGATASGRPLTDHPLRTAEAIQFEPPPEFGAVPAASSPLCIEQRQVCIERALPRPEDVTSIAPKDLADTIATVAGFTNDLFDGRAILGERQDGGNGLLTSQVTLVLQSFRAGQ